MSSNLNTFIFFIKTIILVQGNVGLHMQVSFLKKKNFYSRESIINF